MAIKGADDAGIAAIAMTVTIAATVTTVMIVAIAGSGATAVAAAIVIAAGIGQPMSHTTRGETGKETRGKLKGKEIAATEKETKVKLTRGKPSIVVFQRMNWVLKRRLFEMHFGT